MLFDMACSDLRKLIATFVLNTHLLNTRCGTQHTPGQQTLKQSNPIHTMWGITWRLFPFCKCSALSRTLNLSDILESFLAYIIPTTQCFLSGTAEWINFS